MIRRCVQPHSMVESSFQGESENPKLDPVISQTPSGSPMFPADEAFGETFVPCTPESQMPPSLSSDNSSVPQCTRCLELAQYELMLCADCFIAAAGRSQTAPWADCLAPNTYESTPSMPSSLSGPSNMTKGDLALAEMERKFPLEAHKELIESILRIQYPNCWELVFH